VTRSGCTYGTCGTAVEGVFDQFRPPPVFDVLPAEGAARRGCEIGSIPGDPVFGSIVGGDLPLPGRLAYRRSKPSARRFDRHRCADSDE